jgi:hypothetical protein
MGSSCRLLSPVLEVYIRERKQVYMVIVAHGG